MLEDRGPQITMEVINGYQLTKEQNLFLKNAIELSNETKDLRLPIIEYATKLLEDANIPITARQTGVFAIDFAVKNVSKTTAVKYVISNESVLSSIGLNKKDLTYPDNIEV